jgi:hypothetical protein
MAPAPHRRYGLLLGSLAVAASAVSLAFVTLWTLWVLPLALIIGICAWNGMTLTQIWARMGDDAGADPGRGPAGLGF